MTNTEVPTARPPATPASRHIASLVRRYEQTQWLRRDQLLEIQLRVFSQLASHAYAHNAHFARKLDAAGLSAESPWDIDSFRRIPLMTRRELMSLGNDAYSDSVPPEHAPITKSQTSGSTGESVTVMRGELTRRIWMALTLRDHLWHRRDLKATLAIIRPGIKTVDDPEEARRLGWGKPATLLFDTGPSYLQPISMDVASQAAWLIEKNPYYLLSLPTNISALMDEFRRLGTRPENLRQIRTVGETVSDEFRSRCREEMHANVVDIYSCQEVGVIALECPYSPDRYHIQSESLLVEILDDRGEPCRPGEVGRVVLTDLHNLATPLVRYEIRDYAQAGASCPCGRGLPTLARVVGRRRNMLRLPDGGQRWPLIGARRFCEFAPVLQYQLIQQRVDVFELRLVVAQHLTREQEAQVSEIVRDEIGFPFALHLSYFPEHLPRPTNGKFEEFISLVDDAGSESRTAV